MKRRFGTAVTAAFAAALAGAGWANVAAAQEATEEQAGQAKVEVEETVKTGVIANSGTFPDGSAVNVDTSGAAPGDEQNVIAASVSSVDRDTCQASVTNNSEQNAYSVRFRVTGRNEQGSRVLNKSYSATLDPKERVTRNVSCQPEYRMSVELVSATKR